MSWLNIRTGYSLKAVFGDLERVLKECKNYAGIADICSTIGHIRWNTACKKAGIKPIFGVRLFVSDLHPTGTKTKRYQRNEFTFIATTTKALQEIYKLVDTAYKQFYQFPKLTYQQLNDSSEDIIVLSGIAPELHKIKRKVYLQLSPDLPKALYNCGLEPVACIDNYYPRVEDKKTYESFVYGQFTEERKTTPMHILSTKEWLKCFPEISETELYEALKTRDRLLKLASSVDLPFPPMVEYDCSGDSLDYLKRLCKIGATKRGIKLAGKYKRRLKTELKVIKEKKFSDYFLIVADLIEWCKKRMVVGHARGSSAGSLVCYLIGITEVDPLKYNLLFERFIDINRFDFPDIDFDLQDTKRELAIEYLQSKYGIDCVAQISNINRLQPKSAIIRTAKALNIPSWDIEAFKESIEDRPEGDERTSKAIEDSFVNSKTAIDFLNLHPNMYHVKDIEGHPAYMGVHAAGIIVCPKPLYNYCGINSKEKHLAMVDKRDAEKVNLLKIDALGLTTLNVLAEVCEQLNKPYSWIYTIPLDDKKTYKLLNKGDLSGIFQMEGNTLQNLSRQMKIKTIDDLSALSALCRPGPLSSGAALRYVKQHSGKKPVKYISDHLSIREWTKETFGNIIYQEQLMGIIREYGGLSWEDVTKVRKLMGKSQGDEAFSKYKDLFVNGAIKNGAKEQEAKEVWDLLKFFGQYGFNKSHSISYAIITYLTAYFKANYPLEFAVGILNSTKNDQTALKILRDLKERQGIEYVPFDIHVSDKKWTVHKNKLYGSLTSIDGIGPRNADIIIKCRRENKTIPGGIMSAIEKGNTPFKYLYPGKELYGEYYKKDSPFGKATLIKDIKKDGEQYVFIGMITKRSIRDVNESKAIIKRGGKVESGPTTYISMLVEDDSGSIDVSIGRFHFEEIGQIVTEDTQVNKDWFVIFGKMVNKGSKRVFIEDIRKITKEG